MTLNIEKLLQGGGMTFFSATANPFSSAAVKDRLLTSTTDKSDSGLLSKEVMNALVQHGIPNDVDNYMQQLATFENNIAMGLPVSKSTLYSLLAKANKIIKASNYLDKAESEAIKNGAIDEVAVDLRGNFYAMDEKGKIKKVPMSKYSTSKTLALTVGELIEQRKYSPDLADDFDIFSTINSNVGIEKINDFIKNIISTIGSSNTSSEAYVDLATLVGQNNAKKPTLSQLEAIKGIANEFETIGMDAIFKNKEAYKSKNIGEAFKYILSVLPNNMRNQLYGKYVANGNSLEEAQHNIYGLVQSALLTSNDTSYNYQINEEKTLGGKTATGAKGSSKTFYLAPNEAFFDGDLNQTIVTISDPSNNNKTGVNVKGNQMPALTTDNGNAVANLPLGLALTNTIGKYLNKYKMYMGEQRITEGMLNNIAYSNDKVAAVYMPVDEQGNINWDGFHGFSLAEDYIKSHNITDINLKNNIHYNYGSYALYNDKGELTPIGNTDRFVLTYGYTIDDFIDDNNNMVEEINGTEEDEAEDLIDQIYNKKLKNNTGIENKRSWVDDIYKVPVFIKIDDFAAGDAYRYGGHGSNMTPKTLQEDMITLMAQQLPLNVILGSTEALYIEN